MGSVLLGVITACSGTTSPSAAIAGDWTLRSVNGITVPGTLASTGIIQHVSEHVSRGAMHIAAGGTYTESVDAELSLEAGFPIAQSYAEAGTWAGPNGSLTFTDQGRSVAYQGTYDGASITRLSNGLTEVFARQ